MNNYVPLNVCSSYSMGEFIDQIPRLVRKAREPVFPAMALVETNMCGAKEFHDVCRSTSSRVIGYGHLSPVKPIIGFTVRIREQGVDAPFALLAKNKAFMRYKKLSADFREAVELYNPNPASLVFDGADESWRVPVRKRAQELLEGCGKSFRELVKRSADFGQQSGLRPEPRCDAALEGVRGRLPPVDVGRRHGT